MKRIMGISVSLLVYLLAFTVSAQEKEQAFIEEAGLDKPSIRALIKDENGNLWIGTDGEGLIRYDGELWTRYTEENGLLFNSARYLGIDHDGVLWVGTPRGAASFDGTTWTSYTSDNSGLSGSVNGIAVDANNVKWFASAGIDSFDGTTWETVYTPTEEQILVSAVGFDLNGVLWVGTYNGIMRYDGDSWDELPPADSDVGPMSAYTIVCDKNNVVWFGGFGGIVSFDGKTWKRYSEIYDPNRDRIVDIGICYYIWVDEDNTVWFSSGKYYDELNDKIEWKYELLAGSYTLLRDGNTWWLGNRFGLSVYVDEIIITAVDESDIDIETVQVLQSYPNPFNEATTIDFTMDESGFTTLTVYSVSGQKIRGLVSDYTPAGSHSVVWNGTNNRGVSVSSGVYIARLTSPGKLGLGRILFVK